MKIPGQLPSVQDLRRGHAPLVVEGKLATAGVILGITLIIVGLPFLHVNRWWRSVAILSSTGLLLRAFFRCSNCGKRRPFLGSLGGKCPHCAGPSVRHPDPIEPR